MTAYEVVISIASRALSIGADPADVAAFLARVLETPEEEFARILAEAERS